MYRNCSDTANHKITFYASVFWDEITKAYQPADAPAIKAIIADMRARVGEVVVYDFPEAPKPYREFACILWRCTVAAYCFCMAEQRPRVAAHIHVTLDRFDVLLGRL